MGSHADELPQDDEITILVTGFAPFRQQYPVNPAWEIANALPPFLSASNPKSAEVPSLLELPRVRLLVYPEPVRVSYKVVRDLVPKLWEGQTIDYAVHIGMASGRKFYSVERGGHRTGYNARDVDGELLGDEERRAQEGDKWIWSGLPDELLTSVALDDVWRRWRTALPNTDVRVSEDAGRYLCDFIYYSSLAYLTKKEEERRVVFLHVPVQSDTAAIQVGVEACIELIRAIVQSGRMKNSGGVQQVALLTALTNSCTVMIQEWDGGSRLRGIQRVLMAFGNLPNELALDIFHRLESSKDLRALSISCQGLHRLVEPILYSSITQTGRTAIPCFVRTILEKPHLAQHVKKFTARVIPYMSQGPGNLGGQFWTKDHRADVQRLLWEISESAFGNVEFEEAHRWLCAFFSQDNWDATTAFLLRILPNLETLSFMTYYNGHGLRVTSPYFLNRTLEHSTLQQCFHSQPQYSLPKLQNISIVSCDLKTLLPFLQLKSATNLTLDKLSDAELEQNWFTMKDNGPGLQRLSVKGLAHSEVIKKLLHCLSKLTYLRYDYTPSLLPNEGYGLIPRTIGSGFSHLKDSLEELIITNLSETWCSTVYIPDDSYSSRSLGSLAKFTKLRRLEAPAFVLLGKGKGLRPDRLFGLPRMRYFTREQSLEFIHGLPSSLQHLTIASCELEVLDVLTVMFEFMRGDEWKTKKRNLKEVDLVFFKGIKLHLASRPWGWWDEEASELGIVLRRFMKSA
ncbi:hypothetical protein G7Y89_g9758 [Cudoniella acicularis]|uniref:F-box domain-containing protein n=1 Tax=Cudoniella acicularis TaxID=354080 RepID=A0A8H4RE27_9HELO|nr:hypothetical protein G7Y89_g9758 [Cudoniella acicularis]